MIDLACHVTSVSSRVKQFRTITPYPLFHGLELMCHIIASEECETWYYTRAGSQTQFRRTVGVLLLFNISAY